MHRLSILVLLLGALVSLVAAATAPTFCKCTCFSNSTIIEIKHQSTSSNPSSHVKDPPPDADNTSSSTSTSASAPAPDPTASAAPEDSDASLPDLESLFPDLQDPSPDPIIEPRAGRRAQASASCSQCNRAFCLSQSLPICKGAAEKDVVTMCFQRDSQKDQIIVWGFILGTAGLLGWAALRKVLETREHRGGLAAGIAGGLIGGRRARESAGLPAGRGGIGSTGSDAARGMYAGVGGHSRESSGVL